MARYQVHKKFLTEDFCNSIISNYKNFSEHTPRGKWNAWTVVKEKQDELVEAVQSLLPPDLFISWVNITKYEEGESLRIHTDSKSKFTVVVNLNDNYNGGEFVTNKKKHKLETGDIVTFNGNRVQHGMLPVTEGVRYSLNFWFTDGKLYTTYCKNDFLENYRNFRYYASFMVYYRKLEVGVSYRRSRSSN